MHIVRRASYGNQEERDKPFVDKCDIDCFVGAALMWSLMALERNEFIRNISCPLFVLYCDFCPLLFTEVDEGWCNIKPLLIKVY